MKAKKKLTTVQCGDWHLGWGFGGNNNIGKLTLEGDTFTYKGERQGRHGQNYGSVNRSWKITDPIPYIMDTNEMCKAMMILLKNAEYPLTKAVIKETERWSKYEVNSEKGIEVFNALDKAEKYCNINLMESTIEFIENDI